MRRVSTTLLIIMTLTAAALGRALNLEALPQGYVLSPDEVIDTFGRAVVRDGVANQSACALSLPDLDATVQRRETPALLLLSNAPEILDERSLERRRGLLLKARVPAGAIRVLVSHSNQHALPQDLVLRMTNTSDQIADVVLSPRVSATQNTAPGAFAADALVGARLARDFFDVARARADLAWHPPDGDRHRLIPPHRVSDARLVTRFHGLGTAWLTLTTSVPLELEVCAVPADGAVEGCPTVPRIGSQARGLFTQPDVDVDAVVDITDGAPRRWVFGGAERNNPNGLLDSGTFMSGTDETTGRAEPQVNRGDFGGITHFKATVQGGSDSGCVGAMFLLVAGGRKAALLPRGDGKPVVVPQWGGLVLGRARVGETFEYAFTLPPNSWAPVYMVAVPVHRMP